MKKSNYIMAGNEGSVATRSYFCIEKCPATIIRSSEDVKKIYRF